MEHKNDKENVYEEWRTYPPVPQIKIETSFSNKDEEDYKESTENLSAVKTKSTDR